MSKDNLGDRMKGNYEDRYRVYLTRRTPVIIRIDGKAFHTFTKGMRRPWDGTLTQAMWNTAKYLCENIMGCKLAYVQSDEISLLLIDYDKLTSQAWFDYNLQKICSVAASMATMAFNEAFSELAKAEFKDGVVPKDSIYNRKAMFDARAFNIPESEVCNYFIWRQQDATRNSIETVGQFYFRQSELQNKNCSQIQDMLIEKHNVNWNDFATVFKRGTCIVRKGSLRNKEWECLPEADRKEAGNWIIYKHIPVFTQDREFIERYLIPADTE